MPAPKHVKAKKQEAPILPANSKLMKLTKDAVRAKRQLEEADEKKKKAQAEYDRIRLELIPAAMEELGITSFRGKNGGKVHLTVKTYINVRKDDEKKLHAWLKKNRMGSLIKPTVHPGTLKSALTNMLEEGKKLPKFVNTFEQTTAVITLPKA